jgi:alkylhydroperoxidase family enzyme
MQLKTFGFNEEEIKNISKACNEKECIALEYAEASTCHAYDIDSKLFKKMKDNFTDEQIVEITSVVGLFNFVNRFNDSLGVLPDVK